MNSFFHLALENKFDRRGLQVLTFCFFWVKPKEKEKEKVIKIIEPTTVNREPRTENRKLTTDN
jgi:hypothetical protein